MKKDNGFWGSLLITSHIFFSMCFLFFIVMKNMDGLLLPLLICVTAVVVVGVAFIPVYNNVVKRLAAVRAMGKSGFTAVMKDKVARTAYKGIYALLSGDFAKSEEYLMKAYHLSDLRNNQLFCIEWLVRLYEASGNDSLYDNNSAKLKWCYRRAAEISPDNPEIQSRLGHSYYVDGKLDKAMYCFKQAIKYDPTHGYSHYSIAKIHACRGEDSKAVSVLEELATFQENHPLIYGELATIYAMHRDEDKCREYYEKAMLCGYENPDRLSARITAIFKFNNADYADGDDLPNEYYRYRQIDDDERAKNCGSECKYCSLHKKEKEENDAGDE